MVECECESKRS